MISSAFAVLKLYPLITGDALGVYPQNNQSQVEGILQALGYTGQEGVETDQRPLEHTGKWVYRYINVNSIQMVLLVQ